MSQNYPNRKDWLKVRRTPRKNPRGRFFHVSTSYQWVRLPIGSVVEGSTPMLGEPQFRKMTRGTTYAR